MSGFENWTAETSALALEREILPPRVSPWRIALRMGLRKPLGALSAFIIVLVFGAAIFAGWPPLVDMKDAKPFLARYEAEESFFVYDEAKFMEVGLPEGSAQLATTGWALMTRPATRGRASSGAHGGASA